MNSTVEAEGIPRGSLRAAYLFQFVNLSVSVLTVPVLLHYLNTSGYVLWSVFTVFGAVTLQLQNGIQPVAVREIAREFFGSDIDRLSGAIRRARNAYWMLVAFIVGPLLITGVAYLHFVVDPRLGTDSIPAWVIFAAAYAINYAFAANSAILLGTVRIAQQYNINSLTRALNFLLTALLLAIGLSVLGICISFAVNVLLGCLLTARASAKRLREVLRLMQNRSAIEGGSEKSPQRSIWKYLVYSLPAYLIYNGALLVATAIFPKQEVADYGLSIQTLTLMTALAVVPLQVWLSRLVGAIRRQDRSEMFRELIKTLTFANSVFCVAYGLLAVLGNPLLNIFHSRIHILSGGPLSLIFIAYLVELNLLVFANFLVTAGRYDFVRVYLCTSVCSLLLSMAAVRLTENLILSLVVVPLTIQSAICLPIIFRFVCKEVLRSPYEFITGFRIHLKSLIVSKNHI